MSTQHQTPPATPFAAHRPTTPLAGTMPVPGDKSISHRALMFGAMAVGETRISGLLEGEDVLRTAAAMRALGAEMHQDGPGAWRVAGRGVGGLREPEDVLDMGNSGTAARLLAGILASHPFFSVMTGDASLRRRPSVCRGATGSGGISTTPRFFRCRILGNTRGMRRGISPSIASRWR